jgi:hypothetical protein
VGSFGSVHPVFDCALWRGTLFSGRWDYLCRLSSETVASSMPTRLSQSTWSPFQSPEVREICANLTPAEHTRLIDDARQRGTDLGRWFAAPFSLAFGLILFSWQWGLVSLVFFVTYFVVGAGQDSAICAAKASRCSATQSGRVVTATHLNVCA